MCDGEEPGFWYERTPRANKVHKCIACGVQVGKGERYQRVSGKWDGGVESFSRCLRCAYVAKRLAEITHESVDIYLDCGNDPLQAGKYPDLDTLAFWLPGDGETWATK